MASNFLLMRFNPCSEVTSLEGGEGAWVPKRGYRSRAPGCLGCPLAGPVPHTSLCYHSWGEGQRKTCRRGRRGGLGALALQASVEIILLVEKKRWHLLN